MEVQAPPAPRAHVRTGPLSEVQRVRGLDFTAKYVIQFPWVAQGPMPQGSPYDTYEDMYVYRAEVWCRICMANNDKTSIKYQKFDGDQKRGRFRQHEGGI
jgi:hypothetical protein